MPVKTEVNCWAAAQLDRELQNKSMKTIAEINRIQELVYELRADSAMTKNFISVRPETGMKELRAVLRDNRISGVPVVENEHLVGIVSIEDFLNWLADDGSERMIAEKMSREVVTVYSDEPLVHVVSKLDKHGYGRLPVLDRQTSKLAGIITKGNIIERLLKELEVGYLDEEIRHYRASHFFGDMVADATTLTFVYEIKGRKIEEGGAVASALKKNLRRLGIRPDVVRKAAIAMYEAEMNVIIYAGEGRVRVAVGSCAINISIKDRGPGIPDVEEAKRPGYSTAPEWVRELGFGAGMGLANIEHCCESLDIISTQGKGTNLKMRFIMEKECDHRFYVEKA